MEEKDGITINDVAEYAGVSAATVSRVMRNNSSVKHDTKKRVLEAAEKLQYKKETYNTGSVKNRKTSIAVIIPTLLDPFFVNALKGIMDQADMFKYQNILFETNDSSEKELEIIDGLDASYIDGIIIIPSGNAESTLNLLIERKINFLFLDRTPAQGSFSSVTSDDHDGAFQATKHLITLGHTQIIYMGGNSELSTEKLRLKGFVDAHNDSNLEIDKSGIFECRFDFDSAFKKTTELLESGRNFTAAFAANDLIALGMKHALNQHGRSIPEDISIVGYGDMSIARYLSLTTVSSPSYEMGRNAFSIIHGLIDGRITRDESVVLRPSLILRDSCRTI